MATLNHAGLCREALAYWKGRGWVTVARSMPLVALRGERFSWDLTLRDFCGEAGVDEPAAETGGASDLDVMGITHTTEERTHDDNP